MSSSHHNSSLLWLFWEFQLSCAIEKLHFPPTFLQSSRRINVMEEVEEQRPRNNTLGSFTFRMVLQSCAQQVPNKSTDGVFILFWIQMQKKAGMRKGSTASSWEGHSNVGTRVPVTTSSSQSSAHPNWVHTSQNTPWDLPARGTSWNHSLNKALGRVWQVLTNLEMLQPTVACGAPSSYSCSVLHLNLTKADGKSFKFHFNFFLTKSVHSGAHCVSLNPYFQLKCWTCGVLLASGAN